MAVELDIKKFFKDNKVNILDNDVFMDEVVRRINLLPTPSSMQVAERDKEEVLNEIMVLAGALKKRSRIFAVETFAVNFVVCALILCLAFALGEFSLESPVLRILSDFRYLICGIVCVAFVFLYNRRIRREIGI